MSWLQSAVLKTAARFDPHLLVIRVGMAAMFVESAIDKAFHFDLYVGQAVDQHVPLATVAILGAILVEAAGSAALLFRRMLVPALLALATYTLIVNLFFFDFWNMSGLPAIMARKEFLKNVAVAAGIVSILLALVERPPR